MEQDDKNLFNRAKLINIGAKMAKLRWQEKCSIADNEINLCIEKSRTLAVLVQFPKQIRVSAESIAINWKFSGSAE